MSAVPLVAPSLRRTVSSRATARRFERGPWPSHPTHRESDHRNSARTPRRRLAAESPHRQLEGNGLPPLAKGMTSPSRSLMRGSARIASSPRTRRDLVPAARVPGYAIALSMTWIRAPRASSITASHLPARFRLTQGLIASIAVLAKELVCSGPAPRPRVPHCAGPAPRSPPASPCALTRSLGAWRPGRGSSSTPASAPAAPPQSQARPELCSSAVLLARRSASTRASGADFFPLTDCSCRRTVALASLGVGAGGPHRGSIVIDPIRFPIALRGHPWKAYRDSISSLETRRSVREERNLLHRLCSPTARDG